MRARMLAPMGMTASSPIITNDLRKHMAVGYEPLSEGKPFPLRGPLAEAQWLEVDIGRQYRFNTGRHGEVHSHACQSRRVAEGPR